MEQLSAALRAKQATTTDCEFAKRLGVSQSHWTRVKLGQRPVTLALARAAVAIWPEMEAIYLADSRAKLHAPGTPATPADNEKTRRA